MPRSGREAALGEKVGRRERLGKEEKALQPEHTVARPRQNFREFLFHALG